VAPFILDNELREPANDYSRRNKITCLSMFGYIALYVYIRPAIFLEFA
jgi:hypothetical protein